MEKSQFLKNLNPSQQAAVEHNNGVSLVIAGAGSGKTRVLTYKIAYLLEEGMAAHTILALTFTNKAAREMRERIEQIVGKNAAAHLWMGTFHSIFYRILRTHAQLLDFTPNFTIYDSADSRNLIKSIIKELKLDDKIYKANTIQSIISNAKNALITANRYAQDKEMREIDMRNKRPEISRIYNLYTNRCKMADAMDFDDLLLNTNILFRDHPEVLEKYQTLFQYILVDEYQDTNLSQHRIVNELSKGHNNLCLVGDDAQSIYSFRGANINHILHLENEYKGLKTFKLERNYRSTQNIVNAANSLIKKNKEQIFKNVYSDKEEGEKINLCRLISDYEEAYFVAARIASIHRQTGGDFDDYAILYRTNAQSRIFEESLRKNTIPYRIYGGLSFYQRKEIKDIIAYLRLLVNHNDEEALKRIINVPARGIGDTTVQKIAVTATLHNLPLWQVVSDPIAVALPINNGTAAKLSHFKEIIEQLTHLLSEKNAEDLTKELLNKTGIYTELYADKTPEGMSRIENVEELINGLHSFVTQRIEEGREDIYILDFLHEVSLATDQDTDEDLSQGKVTLMTVHAAKGLEFKNIFIVGLEEQLFPSAMAMNSDREIEEERRLLYVAITRAETRCTLTYAASRYRNGKSEAPEPSRFLRDIDPAYLSMVASKEMQARGATDRATHSPYSNRDTNWNRPRPIAQTLQATPPPTFKKRPPLSTSTQAANAAPIEYATSNAGTITVGTEINHDRFGHGTIKGIEGVAENCKITVSFDNVGEKQLLTKFAKFTIV